MLHCRICLLLTAAFALEVDVESYGARADAAVHLTNATLSTDGFNYAIAAVSAAGGGRMIKPCGLPIKFCGLRARERA